MQPMVGQVIHRSRIDLYDLKGCRLNWRPDNTARVSRPEPDLAGMMQCCVAATCEAAQFCAAGKPHAPDSLQDKLGRCFDHRPYVVGGVEVWGTGCEAGAR